MANKEILVCMVLRAIEYEQGQDSLTHEITAVTVTYVCLIQGYIALPSSTRDMSIYDTDCLFCNAFADINGIIFLNKPDWCFRSIKFD